jgi:hypothetical protein
MRVRAERRTDDEAREALIGVLVRALDEYRFGLRDVSPEDLVELARETPAEAAMRLGRGTRDNR